MSISLDKSTAAATDTLVSLMKDQADKGIDLGEVSAQVQLVVDYSGSMSGRYPQEVDDLVTRCLALSLTGLDDDGEVPVHFFHHSTFDPIVADRVNYTALVKSFMTTQSMGGTNYVPVLKQILGKKRFGKSKDDGSAPPNLIIFVTDGVPGDQEQTKRLLVEASDRPFFFAFIGLGVQLDFLRKLDTMDGRVLDNVSLTSVADTTGMTDEQFFRTILDEWLTQWLPAARRKGITP